jgi:hypothetical protein
MRPWLVFSGMGQTTKLYTFSVAPGWNTCVFNCVTYPRYHDVPIPEGFTGQVKQDIKILETMPGATPWEPKP